MDITPKEKLVIKKAARMVADGEVSRRCDDMDDSVFDMLTDEEWAVFCKKIQAWNCPDGGDPWPEKAEHIGVLSLARLVEEL